MKRSDFLKSIFSGVVFMAAAPKGLPSIVNNYKFSDVFKINTGNENLIYPIKDSFVYDSIKKSVCNRVVSKDEFRYYDPVHQIIVPVKDFYNIGDFEHLINCLNSVYHKDQLFSEYDNGVFFRMIKQGAGRAALLYIPA